MYEESNVKINPELKIATFSEGNANYCAITDKGTRAIATSSHGVALAIDLETENPIKVQAFKKHNSAVQQCALTSFGRAAATASLDGTVRVWNTDRPSQEWKKLTYRDYNRALGVAMSRDGKTIAACFQKRTNQSGVIVLYTMPEFERITWWKTKKLDLFSGAIAISDDGAIVAHCSKTRAYAVQVQSAKQFGVNNPKSHKRWPVTGESHVAMSGDGCTLVVADSNSLRILGLADNEVTELEGYQRSFRPFCSISQSGNRVAAPIHGNKFRIWDVQTGKIITDVLGFEHYTRGCALNEDGNIFLTCSFDQTIYMTNLQRALLNSKQVKHTSASESIDIEPKENSGFFHKEQEIMPNTSSTDFEVIENENLASQLVMDDSEDLAEEAEVDVGRATSGRVSKLVQQLEDMAKQNDRDDAEQKTRNKPDMSPTISLKEEQNEEIQTDEVSNSEDQVILIAESQVTEVPVESQNIDDSKKSRPDPREVFASALDRFDRTSDGNLLHIQASEALDELFESADLERIGRYAKDDALLSSDVEKEWRINERQFIEAAIKVMTAIRAAKTDKWTAAYTGAAEDLENCLTIPQAASLILSVLGERSPEKETILAALEKNSVSNGEVDFQAFEIAVQNLGFSGN